MGLKRGDHVCAVYSTPAELTRVVAAFLAEGLRAGERSWYVGAEHEMASVQAALGESGIDAAAASSRGALKLLSGAGAYVVRGAFDPEVTLGIFNDAIEQAYTDGFTGFRAAAEMSWALECADGPHLVIVYEALLKTLFDSCRAVGLCLYDRKRMPLSVINGALCTHPIVASMRGGVVTNDFYDPTVERIQPVDDAVVIAKISSLNERCES